MPQAAAEVSVQGNIICVGNYYVAVCSAVLGASAPTEGGEGRGHIVTAACLQLVLNAVTVNATSWSK